ncbi:alpha/beta fold hydrolase [Enterococcus sp. AZ192]|uniref:alpha/beta fold hydrolase n=1 Tax=unclassified Enterococcus TaxID=2608891 RepID=UPI003D2E88A4
MKRKKMFYTVLICLALLFTGCTSKKIVEKQPSSDPTSSSVTESKSAVPTLFIHGYSGGSGSFGGMIKRLEADRVTKKELVLTVSVEGEVKASGNLTGKQDNPSIQVLFEDNKNNEWNQAEWIKNCLIYLRDTFDIDQVNLVGHSMGGISALRYLTTYGDDPSLPAVQKFVAIAAPFNNFVELSEGETIDGLLTNGPSVQSERYADYANGINKVSTRMPILILAGDIEDGSLSDEIVPVADALSVVALFKAHGNSVQEKIFYGKNAQHSQLHENREVDQTVANFLWLSEK